MTAVEPKTLLVELWFEREPELDADELLSAVRERLPDSERAGGGPMMVAHPRFVHEYADGKRASIMTAVLTPNAERAADQVPDPSQTYDWDEAGDVLGRCPHSLAVAELFGRVHPYRDRIEAFRTTAQAIVRLASPAAVWCPNSTRVVEPARFVADDLAALVNVRMFRVEDEPGVLVMDTLGLDALALPDLQCHFRDLEPGRLAGHLYDLAAYLLEHGDVVEDGHTVAGPEGGEHWRCRREIALVEPERVVLDIDPGPPHAATHA